MEKNYKVMIVDDESIIREGLKKHIPWERLGMKVCGMAESAENAMELVSSEIPDIIIADIRMRGMDGIRMVEELILKDYTPSVILISSYDDFSYAQRAVRLSLVKEYILKPVDIDYLTNLLRKIRKELEEESRTLTAPKVTLNTYSTLVNRLKETGFDRMQLIGLFKAGRYTDAVTLLNSVSGILLQNDISLQTLKRYFSNLFMLFISENIIRAAPSEESGGSSEESSETDPVLGLDLCESREEVLSHMRHVLLTYGQDYQQRQKEKHSPLIDRALRMIEKSYRDPDFNLTSLADALDVTPGYLSTRFSAETGRGFAHYRLEKQIEQAKKLLQDPSNKIYEVSLQVGFTDEKYFSRQFKRFTGKTPKEYRHQ